MRNIHPLAILAAVVIVAAGIAFGLYTVNQPQKVDLATVTEYAQAGKITELHLNETTLTVKTTERTVVVENVTNADFNAVLDLAITKFVPQVTVNMASEVSQITILLSYLVPIVGISLIGYFILRYLPRLRFN